jgi:hypothetical protein
MAVVSERLPKSVARERQAVVLRCLGALMAITGMALALYFGVGPVRITVQAQTPIEQASGEQGTGLAATGQTETQATRVTCVPYLQFDSSADQNPACEAKVHGRLGVAFAGVLLFVAGSTLWVASHGDRAIGLSERRPFIRNTQA